jgi:hypothetical protein
MGNGLLGASVLHRAASLLGGRGQVRKYLQLKRGILDD